MDFSHLKLRCAGCTQINPDTNQEHVYLKWLIKLTESGRSAFPWQNSSGEKIRISPNAITLPLCKTCNEDFANNLEAPVSELVKRIESGEGFNDFEAELLIRWLWKTTGFAWIAGHPEAGYTEKYTLKERCLNPIDEIRGALVLGITLIKGKSASSKDWPLGFYKAKYDAVFGSGVFSRTAMIITREEFSHLIPPHFTQYQLSSNRLQKSHDLKSIFPQSNFTDDIQAVVATRIYSQHLVMAHDIYGNLLYALEKQGKEAYQANQTSCDRYLILTFYLNSAEFPIVETWLVLDSKNESITPLAIEYSSDFRVRIPVSMDARQIEPNGAVLLAIRTDIDLKSLQVQSTWVRPKRAESQPSENWYDFLTNINTA